MLKEELSQSAKADRIALGIEIGARLDSLLATAKYNSSEENLYAACLCLTIAGAYQGVLAILQSSAGESHAATLVRTMVEALADLKNLVEDPSYLDQMKFDNADQHRKIFAACQTDPDFGRDQEERDALNQWNDVEKKIYEGTYTKERRGFSVYEKFKRAGMRNIYITDYQFLCSFSHNNLNALRTRHYGADGLQFEGTLAPKLWVSLFGAAANLYAEAIKTTRFFTSIKGEDATAAAAWVAQCVEEVTKK